MSKAIQTMFPGETPWTALLADQCLDIAEEDAFVDFCSGGSCGESPAPQTWPAQRLNLAFADWAEVRP